jgi:hypothetical protein
MSDIEFSEGSTPMGTVIKDLPILDLRGISRAAIGLIKLVENVRTVVLDNENAEAFMRVPREEVRSHLIINSDETLTIGQIEFNDDYLAKVPDNTKLVVLGHTIIDAFSIPLFLRKIKNLRIYGQVLYSDSRSASALLARLERLQGQLLRMQPNAIRWIGPTYLNTSALESISGRPIVSIGPITIDRGVGTNDITSTINSMVHIGEMIGREEAICALLSVCDRRLGTYSLV